MRKDKHMKSYTRTLAGYYRSIGVCVCVILLSNKMNDEKDNNAMRIDMLCKLSYISYLCTKRERKNHINSIF